MRACQFLLVATMVTLPGCERHLRWNEILWSEEVGRLTVTAEIRDEGQARGYIVVSDTSSGHRIVDILLSGGSGSEANYDISGQLSTPVRIGNAVVVCMSDFVVAPLELSFPEHGANLVVVNKGNYRN